jgi:hypothetical protein
VTAAQILAAARELMLTQHGKGCPDRPFWEQLARLLGDAEARALAVAEIHGADVVDERTSRPVAIAVAYLDAAHISTIKEPAHARH